MERQFGNTGRIVDISAWTWNIWGDRTDNILLSENVFEVVLANFCYNCGANASVAVRKIATNQKDYHNCSSCVIVCWIAKVHQSITVKKC